MTPQHHRLTLLVRADFTGLGIQTRSYYKWLKPDKTVVIDLSPLNGNEQHFEWYENAQIIHGIPTDEQCRDILSDTDVLLTAETPYNMNLYKIAKEMGVKTISVENPEFYDHIKYPQYDMPDMIILPSVWKEDEIRQHAENRCCKVVQLHHPVDREDYQFRLRTDGRPMHSSGKPAVHDRNGTWDFLYVCPDGTVVTQDTDFAWTIRRRYSKSKVYTVENHHNDPTYIHSLGDIMVIPRKYGGNCLPLNEALSCGMPVIMPDISPNNHILPKEWLVPATIVDSFEPRTKVDIYSVDIDKLSERIKWVQDNIESQSKIANEIADTISWEVMLPKYQQAIESIL